jgi:hypothetical protein
MHLQALTLINGLPPGQQSRQDGLEEAQSGKSTCSAQSTAKIKGKRFRHGSKDQGRKFCWIGCSSLQKDEFLNKRIR